MGAQVNQLSRLPTREALLPVTQHFIPGEERPVSEIIFQVQKYL